MKEFKDKVAVITGGASGVGRCIALALAKEGANVVIGDVDTKELNNTVNEILSLGYYATGQYADVTNPKSMQDLVDTSVQEFGDIHLVFANAGVGTGEGGNLWEYDLKDWE